MSRKHRVPPIRIGYVPRESPWKRAGIPSPLPPERLYRCTGCHRRVRNSVDGWLVRDQSILCPSCVEKGVGL